MKRILNMKVITAAWIAIGFTWGIIGSMYFMAPPANAHDGTKGHALSQAFSFDYNAEHGVYCAWRHSYEGISCVNVDE